MQKVTDKLIALKNVLLGASEHPFNVYHYWRDKPAVPYVIWQEDGEDVSEYGDNVKLTQQLTGSIDFYTKTEFDPIIDDLQSAMSEFEGFGWDLEVVTFETDTGLIHYHWAWRMV